MRCQIYLLAFIFTATSLLAWRAPGGMQNLCRRTRKSQPVSMSTFPDFFLQKQAKQMLKKACLSSFFGFMLSTSVLADSAIPISSTSSFAVTDSSSPTGQIVTDINQIKLPFEHINMPLKDFLGSKATVVFNMKIDDPQTSTQFQEMLEIYKKYKDQGLNVLAFPTEQGWFEPDDDETCRLKAKEYYGFGDFPHAVVFDKVDLLGPSAHPAYVFWTHSLPTPNGYERITLNYEKFLLDSNGNPVRRYPRKFTAYDMEEDIKAMVSADNKDNVNKKETKSDENNDNANNDILPPFSAKYLKAWREAKREVIKSEYAFRYNYNYYNSPNSMYKYNPTNDMPK